MSKFQFWHVGMRKKRPKEGTYHSVKVWSKGFGWCWPEYNPFSDDNFWRYKEND